MNRRGFLFSGAAALALAGCQKKRGSGFNGYAFVANEEGQAIAAVDMVAFAVARHIRLDAAPGQVISHPSRPLIYALAPKTGDVFEIDADRLQITRKGGFGWPVDAAKLAPEEPAIWGMGRQQKRLARLPLDSLKPDAPLALAHEPVDFDLSRYTAMAAVSNGGAGSVELFDLKNRSRFNRQYGPELSTVRFRSDGRVVLAANPAERLLSVIRATDGRVMTHLPLAIQARHFCFNQDGGQLFLTGAGLDAVVVVYPYNTPQVAETALGGHEPAEMAASRQYLFVSNPKSGDVSILNIETRKVIAVAAVGADPGSIVVTPDDQYALVLNRKSGDMAVLRVSAITATRKKTAALFTMIPVGSKPVSAVVRAVV